MRSLLAALRSLVLPYGATSGNRIILDGVNGQIKATNDLGSILLSVTGGSPPALDFLDASGTLLATIVFTTGDALFISGPAGHIYLDTAGVFLESNATGRGFRLNDGNGYVYSESPRGTMDNWQTPTFQNGWSGSLQYKRYPDGYVRFYGSVVPGTRTGGTIVFTLPAGYRPLSSDEYPISWSGGGFWNKLAVNTDGTVRYWDGSGGGSAGTCGPIGFATV